MPTISDYITQLQTDKGTLKTNLETKGITGLSDSDTFTQLVPEVLNIEAVNNQSKSETITTNGTITISPDTGYTGLSEVEITTNVVPDYSTMYDSTLNAGISGTRPGIQKSIKSIPIEMTPTSNTLASSFFGCNNLVIAPRIVNTSSVTTVESMFRECSNLKTIQLFDTSNVTSFSSFCLGCINLEDFPQFNMSSATSIGSILSGGNAGRLTKLTTTSLNNILGSLAGATSYTGTKTLYYVFGDKNMSTYYPASTIQALSNYQAFTDAGWTIGWS